MTAADSDPVRISVVLPNRDHARELVTSLDALARQTRPPDECIVVDDASTDDSLAVIETYRDRLRNLRVLRNESHLGVAESVRRGVEASQGTYIVLASADERLEEHACATLGGLVDSYPDMRLGVANYAEWFAETGEVRTHDRSSELGMWYVHGDQPKCFDPEAFHRLLRRRFVWLSINSAIIRRDTLLEVGVFDPMLRWHGDWFAIYAIAARNGFCAVPRSVAWFRQAPHSYSAKGMRDGRAQRQVAFAIQRKLRNPEFCDFDRMVMRAPVLMSTFFRHTVLALATRPAWYPRLFRLSCWWACEVARGRRPAAVARLVERLGRSANAASLGRKAR